MKPKILIIDDERIIRDSLSSLLKLKDYWVCSACDGKEGLEVFRKEKPDIAIVNIKMPGMDGIKVFKKIKEMSKFTEVILITGHGDVETAIQAMNSGAFGYIQKPFEQNELEIVITRALEKQTMQRKLDEYLLYLEKTLAENRELKLREKAEKALQHRIEIEKLITSISTTFINLDLYEVDKGISIALRYIGEFTGVDRSYVFIFNDDKNMMDNTHEWCRQDVTPQLNNLKGIPVNATPWFMAKIRKHETVHIPLVTDLPPEACNERVSFEKQNIKSLICVPMVYSNTLIGFLGLDSICSDKRWSDEDINLLKMAGEIIVNSIIHKNSDEARNRFRTILEQAGEAIYFIDPLQGRFIDVNKTAGKQLGYSAEELLTMKFKDINAALPFYTQEEWIEQVKKIKLSPEPLLIHSVHRRKDGSTFPVEISVSWKTFSDKEYLLAVVRDITERKHAEQRLELQQQQLIQADKMASLGIIAAGVAHEINNPLTVSIGDLHLFKRDIQMLVDFVNKISDIQHLSGGLQGVEKLKKEIDLSYMLKRIDERLGRSRDAMERIKEIVRQLRDFSHVDSGTITCIDMNKAIESTLQMIPQKYQEGIIIKKKFGILPQIHCYGGQINQVIMNIVINSLQSMKGEGILSIETVSDDSYIKIKFRDTGPGIPKESLKHIFDPFYTTKPPGEGTGLGLSVSYSIIERHGGEIVVENNNDKGVTFTVKLLSEIS